VGRRFSAELTATDSETGLALLHISPFGGMDELIVRRDEQNLGLVVQSGDRQDFFPSPLQGRGRAQ